MQRPKKRTEHASHVSDTHFFPILRSSMLHHYVHPPSPNLFQQIPAIRHAAQEMNAFKRQEYRFSLTKGWVISSISSQSILLEVNNEWSTPRGVSIVPIS